MSTQSLITAIANRVNPDSVELGHLKLGYFDPSQVVKLGTIFRLMDINMRLHRCVNPALYVVEIIL